MPLTSIQKFSPRETQRLLRRADTPPRRIKRFRGGTGKVRKEWTVAEMQLLGTMSDEEASRRLGRTVKSVRHKRRSLGIPPLWPGQRFWTAGERALLGRVTDTEATRRLNRTLESVISMRRTLGLAPCVCRR